MPQYSLLLVDDNEELLDDFSTWFSRRGFRVTAAHQLRLALAAAAENQFDAAVIDLTLPEIDDFELIDQMIGDIPVILLSADDDPRLSTAASQRSVYRLLLKPVSMRAMEEVVRNIIQKSEIPAAAQTASTLESHS